MKRDRFKSLHGIHVLISCVIRRYGYRGLYYRDDDIFSIYRAALVQEPTECPVPRASQALDLALLLTEMHCCEFSINDLF